MVAWFIFDTMKEFRQLSNQGFLGRLGSRLVEVVQEFLGDAALFSVVDQLELNDFEIERMSLLDDDE